MKDLIEKEARRVYGPTARVLLPEPSMKIHHAFVVTDPGDRIRLAATDEPTPYDAERRLLESLRGQRSLGPAPTWWNRLIGRVARRRFGRYLEARH